MIGLNDWRMEKLNTNPLISVLIPVCDEIVFLEEAIESILCQTYQCFEIIIVDGSDDLELVKSNIPNDDRIHYHHRKKNGIADALNYGLSLCKGDYIARMDSDDVSDLNRFQIQIDFLEKHRDITVVGTWFSVIDKVGNVIEIIRPPISNNEIAANIIFENPICHPSVMFRRVIVDEGFEYPLVVAEDYALWTELIPAYKFANIPEVLFSWRRTENANTNVMEEKVCKSDIKSGRAYVERILNLDLSQFQDRSFIKNFSKSRIRSELKKDEIGAITEEFLLVKEMSGRCDSFFGNEILNELSFRWRVFTGLSGYFDETFRKFRYIDWSNELDSKYLSMDYVGRTIADNIKKRSEIIQENKRFILYGMGADGRAAIRMIEKLKEEGRFCWNMIGVADRNKTSITIGNNQFETMNVEDIIKSGFDYVVVSSSRFFDEIVSELCERGIVIDKIINDSVFYYM